MPTKHEVTVFNANFYLVSATVIPVFFLAVTLQGRIFSSAENLMRRLLRSAQERLERFEQTVGAPDRQPLNVRREIVAQSWRLLLFQLIWMISIVVLAVSVIGETLAVLALDQGRASALVHTLVLAAVFGLTIGTGILLYVRLQMLWSRNMRLVFLRYPRNQSRCRLVDHAGWGGIQQLPLRASRMAVRGWWPWLRAVVR
jgi:hypothetical protein